ncbi:MAG: hypothetical protein ACKODB_04075, partial [Betaproteobacteria bacterium]
MNSPSPLSVDALPECAPHDSHPRPPRVLVPKHAWDGHAHGCGPRARVPLVANLLYIAPEAPQEEYR